MKPPKVEWQVVDAHSVIHIFHDPCEVALYLRTQLDLFSQSWDQKRTCSLHFDIRRVERHEPETELDRLRALATKARRK